MNRPKIAIFVIFLDVASPLQVKFGIYYQEKIFYHKVKCNAISYWLSCLWKYTGKKKSLHSCRWSWQKTFRKWAWEFVIAIAYLEGEVVRQIFSLLLFLLFEMINHLLIIYVELVVKFLDWLEWT